jgi:hypothetical protein
MAELVLLILLHSVNGTEIYINAGEITTLRETREDDHDGKLVVDGVRCVVGTTDGKFASVREQCSDIRHRLEDKS